METRKLAVWLGAAAVAVAAVFAGGATAQLPISFEAQAVPFAPPASQATYPAYDYGKDGVASGDDRTATATWRVVQATGNCCENYVTTSREGRLYDFGGTYVNYSDDRGVTWSSVRTALHGDTSPLALL